MEEDGSEGASSAEMADVTMREDATATHDQSQQQTKRKEIYTYSAPWTTYAMAWCRSGGSSKFKLAVASFKEEYSNEVKIIQLQSSEDASFAGQLRFKEHARFDHPYPTTKVLWAPKSRGASSNELIATTGDYLRLWSVDEDNVVSPSTGQMFVNNKQSEYCSPLTSFDWNEDDPSIIATCSIDTTCTVWDIEKKMPKTQLIAHDKEVFDISFSCGTDVFGTVGADGSVRMFDLRALEHSTILYESPDLAPLLRIAWNKRDPNYVAAILTDSPKAVILDIRVPSLPMAELVGHQANLNGIAWAPHSPYHICTCGDDNQALIWDITVNNRPVEDPILAYTADAEINQLQWCSSHEEWVAICFDKYLQILRV